MNLKMRLLIIFTKTSRINFGEIRYFHPSGRIALPNGHPIQKGGFLRECRINSNSFETSLCSGYCIVLPATLPEITPNVISDFFADIYGSYTIGNYFKGTYITDSGEIFSYKSIAIGLNGLSNEKLTILTERISKRLSLNRVLIKDFSNNKIFIATATDLETRN